MKFTQLPVGCSFHSIPLSFQIATQFTAFSVLFLLSIFIIVCFTLAFVLYLFSISTRAISAAAAASASAVHN